MPDESERNREAEQHNSEDYHEPTDVVEDPDNNIDQRGNLVHQLSEVNQLGNDDDRQNRLDHSQLANANESVSQKHYGDQPVQHTVREIKVSPDRSQVSFVRGVCLPNCHYHRDECQKNVQNSK